MADPVTRKECFIRLQLDLSDSPDHRSKSALSRIDQYARSRLSAAAPIGSAPSSISAFAIESGSMEEEKVSQVASSSVERKRPRAFQVGPLSSAPLGLIEEVPSRQPSRFPRLALSVEDPYITQFGRPEESFSREEVYFIIQTGHPHLDLSGVDYRRGYHADYYERKKEALELAPRGEWVKDALEGAAFSEGVLPAEEGLSPKAAEIVPTDQGKSGTYFVKNKKGEIVAVFKPYDEDFGERNSADLKFGSTMRLRERPADGIHPGQNTAFECSGRAIFLECFTEEGERCLVPETVHATLTSNAFSTKGIERDVRSHHLTKQGSLQRFIQGRSVASFEPHQAIESIVNPKELERMMAYDLATGSTDRNAGNALVTEDGHLVMIDQAIMCSEELQQRMNAFWYELNIAKKAFSEEIRARISALNPEALIAITKREFKKAHLNLSPEEQEKVFFRESQQRSMRYTILELQGGSDAGLTPYDMYWLRTKASGEGFASSSVSEYLLEYIKQHDIEDVRGFTGTLFRHANHLRNEVKEELLRLCPDCNAEIEAEISYSHYYHMPFIAVIIKRALTMKGVFEKEVGKIDAETLLIAKNEWLETVVERVRAIKLAKQEAFKELKVAMPDIADQTLITLIDRYSDTYLRKKLAQVDPAVFPSVIQEWKTDILLRVQGTL